MVASGQMVTLDSPGSIIMKWSVPTLQPAKLKQLKFFLVACPGWKYIWGVD